MNKPASTSKTQRQIGKKTDKRLDPIHGFLFQLKLLMLFLYRGVTHGYSFILGTEIEEGKKFDDIVFEFTQNEKKFYRLLQARHKFDRTKSTISTDSLFNEINGDFNLPKYFFSYLAAKKESLFSGGSIKDVIICTNINFNDQVFKSKDIKMHSIKNKDDILEIKIGTLTKPVRYKFKEDVVPILKQHLDYYKSRSKSILSDYNEDDIKDFINHLIFAVDFPSEQELGDIIKGEMGKEFDFHDVDNIYSKFMITMIDWLQGKERGRFISDEEGKLFFEEAKKGVTVLFNVRSPVESFTGRVKELDVLHKLLKEPTDNIQAVCITGIGGVGKSELARKYISEFRMEYNNNILWFNAESYQALEAGFRSLARDKLGIATKNTDGDEKGLMFIIEEVYRTFSNRKCLMIFDNAQHYRSKNTEVDEGIDRFLTPFSNVSRPFILITSRNQKWPSSINVLSLEMFEKNEALQFISKVLKTNIDESSSLADEMHCYPLALQQAVSYIKVQNMKLQNIGSHFSINRYLEHLQEKGKDVLNFSFPEDSDIDYTKTVYITWNATLDLIRKSVNGKEALKVMNVLSFMAADDIPIDIFLNLVNDYDTLSSALDILKQYSMITIHHKFISLEERVALVNVHRLVQEVIRLKLAEEKQNKLVLEEALMIFTKRENVNSKTLNHAISVWEYSSKVGAISEDKRQYCSLISTYISIELSGDHRYTELHSFVLKAIEFSISLSKDDKLVQRYLVILRSYKGIALQVLGKYEKAMETFREALSSSETINGKDDPYTLMIKGSLAKNLLKQGNYDEVIKLIAKLGEDQPLSGNDKLTLAEALKALGRDDEALHILEEVEKNINQPESTDYKELLAHVLHMEGKLEDSLCLYRTLDWSKESPSIKTHCNLNKRYKIAQIYLAQKKYTEALEEFEGVLLMGREIFGPNHPEILWCQHIIAEILRSQTKYDRALKMFEETYEKQKAVLGKDHPDTLDSLFGIAVTLKDEGKLKDSLSIHQVVLKKRFTKLGMSHPSTLEACTSIGDIFLKMEDYDEALEMYSEVLNLKIKEKNKVDNLAFMIKTGKRCYDRNDVSQALPIFKDALKVIKDNYGCDHYDYLSVSNDIAVIYLNQGKYDLALDHFYNILKIQKRKLGEDNSDCLLTKYRIAETLSFKNKCNKSLKTHRELLRILDVIYGKDHPQSLTLRNKISTMYFTHGKFDEALQECKAVIEIQKINPERNQEIISETKKILAQIYSEQNKYEEALNILIEILEIVEKGEPNKNSLDIANIKGVIGKTLMLLGKDQKATRFFLDSYAIFIAILGKENSKTAITEYVLQCLTLRDRILTAVKQNKNTDFIKELVNLGCNFEAKDDEGRTLLHHATNQGNIETVEYLLSIGVDYTQVTEKGNSCLHIAVLKGDLDIATTLLQYSSYDKSREFVDIQTVRGGMAALHVAAKNNNLDLVKVLLKYGAKYNMLNTDNERPIDLSGDKEVKSILQLVDDNFNCIGCGGVNIVELEALKQEYLFAVVNARNESGKTLSQVAISKADYVSAKTLLGILQKMKLVKMLGVLRNM